MKYFFLILLCFVVCCKDSIQKPQGLIAKSVMAEVIAELSMNDQVILFDETGNVEAGTKFILQKYKVSAEEFMESYKYYVAKKQMISILSDSQEILLDQHPEIAEQIKKEIKEQEKQQQEFQKQQ